MLFGNCTFNIESVPIHDGGALIRVTNAALDHTEVAVHQDDSSSGVPNTKQRERLWHRIYKWRKSWLFEDRNLSAF